MLHSQKIKTHNRKSIVTNSVKTLKKYWKKKKLSQIWRSAPLSVQDLLSMQQVSTAISQKLSTDASGSSQRAAGLGGQWAGACGQNQGTPWLDLPAAPDLGWLLEPHECGIPNAHLRVCSFLSGSIKAVNEETPGPAPSEHVLARRRAHRFMSKGLSPHLQQGWTGWDQCFSKWESCVNFVHME